MALTRWILALCGYARLEVCGVHPERVLNACAAAGIACTASEPVDAYTLRITVRAHGARTRWALRAGKKRINFYQNSGISDAECDKITYEYPFAIRGVFTLPFSLVRERVQPYRTADAPVSEDAARASLEQALLQQLRETIGDDGAIISYETAAEVTGSVLTVTLTAECEQEIGRAQATPDAEFLQLRPLAGEGTTADD